MNWVYRHHCSSSARNELFGARFTLIICSLSQWLLSAVRRHRVVCSLGSLSPGPKAQWLKLAHHLERSLSGQQSLLDDTPPGTSLGSESGGGCQGGSSLAPVHRVRDSVLKIHELGKCCPVRLIPDVPSHKPSKLGEAFTGTGLLPFLPARD